MQKHRGTYLDPKLDFLEHLKNIQAKVNKPIALLLDPTLIMVTPYMTKLTMILFIKKLESIQYDAALAITGAIRGTSSEKLYQELGLESLQQRRWYRKLCTCFYIIKYKSSDYLLNIISKNNSNHRTRNSHNIPQFNVKHNFFKNSFFPSVIAE